MKLVSGERAAAATMKMSVMLPKGCCGDEVGRLCQTDRTILQIGSVFYRRVRRKKDKAVQVRQTVRIEMRRLGFLYFELKKHKITKQHNNVQDMFIRDNFDSLRDAIDIYST